MGTHLTKTHLLMEAFAVASWRQLPSIHPIFQLLFPHLRSVMAINTIGRNELVAEGGIVDKTLSLGGGGHIQLLEKTYRNFKFEMLSLPDMLKKRGVDDAEKLPNYFYRLASGWFKMWLCDYFYGCVTICNVCHEEEVKKSKAVLLKTSGLFWCHFGKSLRATTTTTTVCKAFVAREIFTL